MKVCLACNRSFNQITWNCPFCGYTPSIMSGYLSFAPELAEVNEGFEAKFFSQLVEIEANNFWFRSRNQLIVWALRHYFPTSRNFLEIGCGTGFVLSGIQQSLPNLALYGSEIFTKGLEFAGRRLSTQLYQMDARRIPFDQEFDVIGAFDVLEHIREDITVLQEMHRSISNGGGVVLTVPQHPWLWSQNDEHAHHVRRYQAKELKNKLESTGFNVVRITSFVSLLLPLMVMSRLRLQRKTLNYDPLAEFKISRLTNFLLEHVLDVERSFIRSGVSLPVGGSLLVVARKI